MGVGDGGGTMDAEVAGAKSGRCEVGDSCGVMGVGVVRAESRVWGVDDNTDTVRVEVTGAECRRQGVGDDDGVARGGSGCGWIMFRKKVIFKKNIFRIKYI